MRTAIDFFTISDVEGNGYNCLVHEPLLATLQELRASIPCKCVNLELWKLIVKHLYLALDFLHTDAGVIHTGELTLRRLHTR